MHEQSSIGLVGAAIALAVTTLPEGCAIHISLEKGSWATSFEVPLEPGGEVTSLGPESRGDISLAEAILENLGKCRIREDS